MVGMPMNKMIETTLAQSLADVSKLFHECFSELSYHPKHITIVKSEVN